MRDRYSNAKCWGMMGKNFTQLQSHSSMIHNSLRVRSLQTFAIFITVCTGLFGGYSERTCAEDYVKHAVCVECHVEQANAWRNSHHDLAMQEATSQSVLGDFNNASYSHFGSMSRFYQRNGGFFIETDGPGGVVQEYEIVYTFGVEPLQQYLVKLPGNRLQALPVAWDTRAREEGGQRWFHLNPGDPVTHDDPLHWTGPAFNWNNMCAECHSTAYFKGYDVDSDYFESSWSEINVACEACHGPGGDHVDWANGDSAERIDNDRKGLKVGLNERAARQFDEKTDIAKRISTPASMMQVETCALCHSRRSATGIRYRHGRPLLESHVVQTLEQDLYFADGQIRDEVYVYGSFLQSKMYADGVVCSDCHDPHSLKLRAEGNDVCATCHLPERFDTPAHHHHESGTDAAQCVNCHMTAQTYMVIDDRRDHSFRVPRPDLSMAVGSPDACTNCHQEQNPAWAATVIKEQWAGKYHNKPHFGYVFDAAWRGSLQSESNLLAMSQNESLPAIVRATAVRSLRNFASRATTDQLNNLLHDPDPLIRLNALPMLDSLPPSDRAAVGAGLLYDSVTSVRLEAAKTLGDISPEHLTEAEQTRLADEVAEYVASLIRESDIAANNVSVGNLYTRFGAYTDAEEWYLRAIKMSPHFVPSYINLADLYRSHGEDNKGEGVLTDALERFPDAGALHHAYGLLLIRLGSHDEARAALRKATELEPENVRFRYVYAVALHAQGKVVRAIKTLEEAFEIFPADVSVLSALINFNQEIKDQNAVKKYVHALSIRLPWDENLRRYLEQLN